LSNKPKIVFAVTTDLTYDQRMQRICHSLAQAGWEVLLVGRQRKQSLPLSTTSYRQYRINCFFEKGKLFYLEYNLRLLLFLLPYSTDLIGSIDLDTIVSCLIVSKIRGKQCVFDAHEYFSEVPEVVSRPLTKKVWEWVAKFSIPKVDAAYTVSASLQQLFTQQHQIPFHLIRNISVSQPTPSQEKPSPSPILFYQGALNQGRGLEELINALTRLEKVHLWIAGEGDLSNILREQVKQLQIENRVTFLGYILPEQLKTLTPKATIGLNLLANKGLSYYYSLANKTFDYIHAGIPAIHPNFPEYQQINQKYDIGILVDDLKEATLATAIHTLLNDPDLYQQLQKNCLSAAKELNWRREEQRLIELYQCVFYNG